MDLGSILGHSVRLYGDKVAITAPLGQMTYKTFYDHCLKMGNALHALGLKRGDRVAVLDFNSIELALTHFGVPMGGMVALPLNHRLSPEELIGILDDSGASVLIYSSPFRAMVDEMRARLPLVQHFICTAEGTKDKFFWALVEAAPNSSFPEASPKDLATLLYTSGTTGRPKGVQLTHGNTASTLASLLVELGLTADDSGVMVAPLFHVAGCHTFMALMARGCTAHILPGFDPKSTLRRLEETKATMTLLVPAMIGAILNCEGQKGADLSHLRLMVYAGAPMPEEMLKAGLHRFGHVFLQIYGLTETSVLTCLTREDHESPQRLSSAGREMYGCEVRLVDDHGDPVGPGIIGEVVARGDNVTPGYWQAEAENLAVIKDGWFHTGDMGVQDESGYLFLRDRKKDMIVTGGENVYPIELENVLHQIPGILEAAVIGVPDEKWGEKVLALIHLRPGHTLTEPEVLAFCRERLAGYKCPKGVVFIGPLPRTPSGKVKKNLLREPYWEGYDRKVH